MAINCRKKTLIGGLSIIVIVIIVVGIAAIINKFTRPVNIPPSDPANGNHSITSKAIASICAPTDYKEVCVDSLLTSATNTTTAEPKSLVEATINATINAIASSMMRSEEISKQTNDTMQKAALNDCRELLEYAIEELKATLSSIAIDGLQSVPEKSAELKNWLSAVISYQQTCIDGVTDQKLNSEIKTGVTKATQLSSNVLAIISEITQVLSAFKIPFNVSQHVQINGNENYPKWLSAGDRRLLATHTVGNIKPNVVVAKDGSGKFSRITDALNAMPAEYKGRYVIYVKAGIYEENVIITKKMVNVFMYGDGPRKTIVSGRKNFVDGTPTYQTATFAAIGNGFVAKSMGFRNTAGPSKHQAVALRVQSDTSVFYNCRMDGFQDTLYTQTHRQFYRNCVISGTIDFVFGDGTVILQNCLLIVRKPLENQKTIVTAQGRSDHRETTGIVIHNSRIVPDRNLFPVRFRFENYLGRPWKEYSRTVIMESTLGDFINRAGWMPWAGDFGLNTLYYREYKNRGPGSGTSNRVQWRGYKVITNREEALGFTVERFIQGGTWLKHVPVPFVLELKN